MRIGAIIILGLLAGQPLLAADAVTGDSDRAAALAAMCAKVPCRKTVRSYTLRGPEGTSIQNMTGPYPYVDDQGTVILYPEETIVASLPITGDKLGVPVLLRVTDPGGTVDFAPMTEGVPTISFTLRQDDRLGMVLMVTNMSKVGLKYEAYAYIPGPAGARPSRTSTCPLVASQSKIGFTGMENWPQPIVMMILTNLHIVPSGGAMVCD
jgi:hypothetical protein